MAGLAQKQLPWDPVGTRERVVGALAIGWSHDRIARYFEVSAAYVARVERDRPKQKAYGRSAAA